MRHLPHNLAAILLLCASSGVQAGDFQVTFQIIANPSVGASSVSLDELKNVFLATKTSLSDGSRVEPVLLKHGGAHEAFLKECLGKTDSSLQSYYRNLVFTGKGSMPRAFGSEAEVVAYVAKNKGAMAYVSSAAEIVGAKILEVK